MIRIDVDFEKPLRMLVNLEDSLRDKVIARTLNRIGDQTKIQARREISREFNLTASQVNDYLSVRRASVRNGRLEVSIVAEARRGRSLNVIRFVERSVSMAQARKRRKDGTLSQVRVKIKRAGGAKILGTPSWAAGKPFIATANGGTFVAARLGKGRYPIQAVQTIDVPSMFNAKRIKQTLIDRINETFPIELQRQFDAVVRGF